MAIYRTGQASMDAQGIITGYGTKWREQLALIRIGATIVFATQPATYATISEIISDTEMRAITTGGAVVTRGDYVIFLHDGLTVEGLAQDVAETLRYYQGKETQLEGFIEEIKNFDMQKLIDLSNQVKTDAQSAEQSKNAAAASAASTAQDAQSALESRNASAESQRQSAANASASNESQLKAKQSEVNAAGHESVAEGYANDSAHNAQSAIESKNASAESQRQSATNAAAAKASETASKASEVAASGSAVAAKASEQASAASQQASEQHAQSAASSSIDAKRFRDEAEQFAGSITPDLLLRKDQNLADLPNKEVGRNNLGLGVKNDPVFRNISAVLRGAGATSSGNIIMESHDDTGIAHGRSVVCNELESGIYKTTISTQNITNNKTSYLKHSENGRFINLNNGYSVGGLSFGSFDTVSLNDGNNGIFCSTVNDTSRNSAICGLSFSSKIPEGKRLNTAICNVSSNLNWPATVLLQSGDTGQGKRTWYFDPSTGDLSTNVSGTYWYGDFKFQKAPTSDRDLKKDIIYNDGKQSYDNIKKMKPCTFAYKADKDGRTRRGIIAQDVMQDVDKDYVKLVPASAEFDDDGNRIDKDDTLALDSNPILMDTALALHHLISKVEKMEEENKLLKAEIDVLKKSR